MSTTTGAKVPLARKYRVKIRKIAVEDNGFEFDQLSTAIDSFTKGDTRIDVHHGPSDLITFAEIVKGNSHRLIKGGRKMFRVRDAITGVEDKSYLRLGEDEIPELESGKGIAKVAVLAAPEVDVKAVAKTVVKAEATPKPKAAPKPKSETTPVPAKPKPRPKPAAAKTAPAAKVEA